MQKFIGLVLATLVILGISIGFPVLSYYVLNIYFGSFVASSIVLTCSAFILIQHVFYKAIIYNLNNSKVVDNTPAQNSGRILTEDDLESLTVSDSDLSLQEYSDRVVFFHHDNTAAGIDSLVDYFKSRVADKDINYYDSPLPVLLKLLSLVDEKLPQSTRIILIGASGNKDEVDEFDDLDFQDSFNN